MHSDIFRAATVLQHRGQRTTPAAKPQGTVSDGKTDANREGQGPVVDTGTRPGQTRR